MEPPATGCATQPESFVVGFRSSLSKSHPGAPQITAAGRGGIRMNRYLLDTNVVSELRKPRPHGAVVAWLNNQPEERLFLSAVTMGELQAGIELTRRQDPSKASAIELWLDKLAVSYQILPMDTPCFREWGRIMDRKPDRLLEDAMIAATARVHQLIVVTRNEADFKQLDVRILNPFKTS